MLQKRQFQHTFSELLDRREVLQQQVESYHDCPPEIAAWMGRLKLLYGVPLNYLVPDERMLPPESIRFFYLDPNWIEALIDGAFSIGRSLIPGRDTRSFCMDRATGPMMHVCSRKKAWAVRTGYLGLQADEPTEETLSGFLLRSSVVNAYPGLGVDVYPERGMPQGENPGSPLKILRMEKIAPDSDTLLCLIEGDAYRVDIHEAPEALHYGIDRITNTAGKTGGEKTVYSFYKEKGEKVFSVTMDMENPVSLDLGANDIFRKDTGSRTLNMARLAQAIGKINVPPIPLDASEMGFEMTEGVGMVSFMKQKR